MPPLPTLSPGSACLPYPHAGHGAKHGAASHQLWRGHGGAEQLPLALGPISSRIQLDSAAPRQLFECATEQLSDMVPKADAVIATKLLQQVIDTMRELAVIPIATSVLRAELAQVRLVQQYSCTILHSID